MASYMNQHCLVPLRRRKLLKMEYFISTFEFMEMYAIYGKKKLENWTTSIKDNGFKKLFTASDFFYC